jgi:choline dehydrogenase-like flavoprotein
LIFTVEVLVIEAGDFDQGEDQILTPYYAAQPLDKYIFNFPSVPLAGLNNRTQPVTAGKLVGGGSAVNGMFMPRGSKEDYDLWEELGNPGWGWDGLLPYFKKVTGLITLT